MNEKNEFTSLVIDDAQYATKHTRKFALRKSYEKKDPKQVRAYIPGVIQKIYVQQGQRVKWGDSLLVLEAMKMKNDLKAPIDGTIKSIHISLGQMVPKDALLIEFE